MQIDDDFGTGDGYDYSQHLREMGAGQFIPKDGAKGVKGAGSRSVASASLSLASRGSQARRVAC